MGVDRIDTRIGEEFHETNAWTVCDIGTKRNVCELTWVNDEVEVVKIENEYATFRIGKDKYYSVSLIGNDLMVSAKWNDSKNLPIIPNTIIYRKMNNK